MIENSYKTKALEIKIIELRRTCRNNVATIFFFYKNDKYYKGATYIKLKYLVIKEV